MNYFFTSDQHFGHQNVITYCKRPYANTYDMDEDLIVRYNATVGPHDICYHLGDFSLSPKSLSIVERLNGMKILIPGNHDACFPHRGFGQKRSKHNRYINAGFADVLLEPETLIHSKLPAPLLMWHLPYAAGDDDDRHLEMRPGDLGDWLLHGHVHTRWRRYQKQINVGVDMWGLAPVSIEQIAELMNESDCGDDIRQPYVRPERSHK